MTTETYKVVIGADLRSYTHLDIEGASPEEAHAKALKQLESDGDLAASNWTWQSETVQGEVSIQVEDGDFKDVPNFNGPSYSELQAEVERLKTPSETVKVTIHSLSFDDDDGTRCELFGTEQEADAALKAYIEPKWDEAEHGPLPEDDLHEAFQKCGDYLDTFSQDVHVVEIPCPSQSAGYAALHRIVADLAQCSTPKQESDQSDGWIGVLDHTQLISEYIAFMEFVHSAQETMAVLKSDIIAQAKPAPVSPKIVIDCGLGAVDKVMSEGLPENTEVYILDRDHTGIEEERISTFNFDLEEIRCIFSKTELETPPLGFMTAVKRAWEDCS